MNDGDEIMSRVSAKSNNMTGLRIAAIRRRNNLSQQQFAAKLSEYMERDRVFTVSTISAWEVGRKDPNVQVLTAISELFGIPIGYITGETAAGENAEVVGSMGSGTGTGTAAVLGSGGVSGDGAAATADGTSRGGFAAAAGSASGMTSGGVGDGSVIRTLDQHQLVPEQYARYDKKPVYVVFLNMKRENQWGLLDYGGGCVVFMDRTACALSEPIELYPLEAYDFPTYFKRRSKPISAAKFQHLEGEFWVEVASMDDAIRHEYNGWYIFNKHRSAIINVNNGLILPIRGFGLSYKCYMEPYDVVE
jgi:DNA-binding transcriptional regulator YiaG